MSQPLTALRQFVVGELLLWLSKLVVFLRRMYKVHIRYKKGVRWGGDQICPLSPGVSAYREGIHQTQNNVPTLRLSGEGFKTLLGVSGHKQGQKVSR